MRITFVCPAFDLSGGQRVIATYAERLRRRGHQVVVVAPPPVRPSARAVLRSLLRLRRPGHHPSGSHFDGLVVERRILDRPRPVTAADLPDADVVVATWWETAEWVADLPPSKGAKAYFIQHHEVFDHLPVERARATYRFPMPKIVVAQWLADLARDEYGDPHACVVPNSVDHALFHAEPRGRRPVPTVGLMYSSVAFKGCDVCLKAVGLATARVPELRLVAFGYYPPDDRMPLPPGAEYHIAPSQERIPELYASCDAWLFGSRSEGFGLPILEAMACRTPVIGTPAGAAPELIGGGGGYLVRPEDPVDMAAAIVRLCRLSDPEWRALSDAAFATAARYTWDDATDQFERALAAVAGAPAAR
jgi:glycosyltransferase involved in cell wall biosynthesis